MYLAAGRWCFLHNKATKYSNKYITVANTKDLDPQANPEGGAALLILLHCLLRKKIATITAKKTAPGGVFCMSGPVAHVDEEEDEKQQSMLSVLESVNGSNPTGVFFVGEKFLPNGDIYAGSWHGNLPEGRGKYLWANGCMYEGHWCRGKKTGNGRISWPSGTTYEGDFLGGYLHGFGTYTGVDGATYKGQWLVNQKHGYGHKCYKNGDFYDGYWKQGVQDGEGRYLWENGNEYVGHWRGGLMCGKGVLKWSSGDIYDGHWLDGLENGHGVYKWADGSYYVGTWSKGLKDGKGIFYPPCANQNGLNWSHESSSSGWDQQDELTDDGGASWKERSPGLSDFEIGLNSSCIRSSETTSSKTCDLTSQRSFLFDVEKSSSAESVDSMGIRESDENGEGSACDEIDDVMHSVVEREYVQGVLINEFVKENVPFKARRRREKQHPKEGKRQGEIIFKGHRNYDLMVNLQLGIRYTVGRITPEPKREIVPADFGPKARIWMRFPPEGSVSTPPHQSVDFKWKDYCPMVFRHLRELFKIDAADYMLSICGNDALRELSSPGKSGSVFYLSHDDRFMIKTMRKSEVKVLLRMLPNYYNHVRAYESTLITKFFGLHAVKPTGGHKVRFIVMGNMFCSELHIHRRFDLKGSSQGRSTDKVEIEETTTLKDLDLDFVFYLEPSRRRALVKQIERDCKFLEAERIMDYSLLLGVHLRAPQFPANFSPGHSSNMPHSVDTTFETSKFEEDGCNFTRRMASVPGKSQHSGRVPVPNAHIDQADLALPGMGRLGIRLGVNMPARANRRPPRSERDFHPEGELFREDYDVVLYFGIIDILQDYDITKKLEHAYKSLQFDSLSISAVDPKLYSKRFQEFICRIFPGNS